ncbi:MAG: NAD(P)H-dependent glycerol-3-phosphate dehydrogenase [Candidatus Margulisiibacteriota bacterium]
MNHLTVIGCGAWATTIAKVLAENGHAVTQWCHRSEYAQAINEKHENTKALPGVVLPASLNATEDLGEALSKAEGLVIGLASAHLHTVEHIKPYFQAEVPVLNLCKGLVTGQNPPFALSYLNRVLETTNSCTLSGPNLALEIASQKPAASVVAGDSAAAHRFQHWLSNRYFRIYVSDDPRGVEVGGIFKNALAIAAGLADGLQLGSNAKAALLTRGMIEMVRLGTHLGGQPATFYGLSGIGDLIATCSSDKSRNWQVGHGIASGTFPLPANRDAQNGPIAEGVKTAAVLSRIGHEAGLDLPILYGLESVLFKQQNPLEVIQSWMGRDLRHE